MFSIRQKLVIAGAALIAVLIVVVSYFGSRWLHGPDVEPIPEHVLNAAGVLPLSQFLRAIHRYQRLIHCQKMSHSVISDILIRQLTPMEMMTIWKLNWRHLVIRMIPQLLPLTD